VRDARRVLEQRGAPSEERISAIEDLSLDKFDNQRDLLEQLLSPQESAAVRATVLATLGQYDSPGVAPLILSHYEQFPPAERLRATDVLLRRGSWAFAF